MAAAPSALVQALQDRYTIERELGSGGMATVYLARDLHTTGLVAIKVLRPDLVPVLGADRFAREIRITSRLKHPNILPVLDSGKAEDGLPFFVTPYIDGESLARRLQREGQLPIADTIDIACQVADALHAAHSEGFVHRDIKPGNILMSGGHVFLADFGISRAVEVATGEKLTESGMALGTPAYMSPEQYAGGQVDGRTDIYSLGCVVFEMLSGSPPFTGGSLQSVRARHATDPPPSLRTVRGTVSPPLEHVVHKALAKVPADRYASALHFKVALQRIDLTDEVTVERPGWTQRRPVRLVVALAALAAAGLTWHRALPKSSSLDPNRIMVYPLMAAGFTASPTVGEDVATLIGSSLDGSGPLRWIDGWGLLEPGQRDDVRSLSRETARSLARAQRCAYYVFGRLVASGDSAQVFLDVHDVEGDSTVARGRASGLSDQPWRLGLRAVNEVLPRLIPAGAPDLLAEWTDRDPRAVASFLLGEAAFRRVHLVEALKHYRAAVKTDSLFGLAAVRGAQAATWNHRLSEAASLIEVATKQQMPQRYTHFARGYKAYLEGRADSAAAELRRALELDPEMAVAWMQLGEVYTHLLPESGSPQPAAEDAFERAHAIDSTATNILLHLIEIRLRKGEIAAAQPIVRRYLAGGPDNSRQIEIMNACAQRGAGAVDWPTEASRDEMTVLLAGQKLAGAGARLDCAIPAFAAVTQADTTLSGDVRWFALLGLQAALLAQDRVAEAMAQVDSSRREDAAAAMYLIDAPVFPELTAKAAEVARNYKAECGAGYTRCANPYRVWQLGVWDAQRGHMAEAETAARTLYARAARETVTSSRNSMSLLARSVEGHAALARSDTSSAIKVFHDLVGEPAPGADIEWDIARPRGLDRLRLAELLLATGDPARALAVADVLDSAAPSVHLIYLAESLRLRARAANAAGNPGLAAKYGARLAALRSTQHSTQRQEGVI